MKPVEFGYWLLSCNQLCTWIYPTVLDKKSTFRWFANFFNSSGDLNATSISEGIFQDVKDSGGIIPSLDLMIEIGSGHFEVHGFPVLSIT